MSTIVSDYYKAKKAYFELIRGSIVDELNCDDSRLILDIEKSNVALDLGEYFRVSLSINKNEEFVVSLPDESLGVSASSSDSWLDALEKLTQLTKVKAEEMEEEEALNENVQRNSVQSSNGSVER